MTEIAEAGQPWLDVLELAEVRSSSEDALFPLANLFAAAPSRGWRAAEPGPQTIVLRFRQPQTIARIRLHAIDRSSERTQTITFRAGSGADPGPDASSGETAREIARLTFEFQPRGSTEEFEDLPVELSGVTTLELDIDPGVPGTGQDAGNYATLTSLQLAAG